MPLAIQTNVASLSAQRNVGQNQMKLLSSFDRLSSGFRVNSAKDDAAGLAISESMKSQIRSFTVAERNAGDGISMAQTAEGALGDIHDVLGRMRELGVQSSNGSLTGTDRGYINTEFSQLKDEISRIQQSAKFNGASLVDAATTTVTFQVGLNNVASDQISVDFGGVGLTSLLATASTVSTLAGAQASLATIDTAIATVSTARSRFGAAMNRLEVSSSNIQTMRLNVSAANSRIRDVDVAAESSSLSRNQVLVQSGISMLAQANQLPQLAQSLLR
jgi:flagellin